MPASRSLPALALAVVLVGVAACDSSVDEACALVDPPARTLVACVAGDVEVSVAAATTLLLSDVAEGGVEQTTVDARGQTGELRPAGLTVILATAEGEAVATGTYPVAEALPLGVGGSFVNLSLPGLPAAPRTFTAVSGTVVVESVSAGGAVAGRLDVVAEDAAGRVEIEARFRAEP